MHLANLTTAPIKKTCYLLLAIFFTASAYAQENSPYSQYGMGDLNPNMNTINKSMGGITAGYSDGTTPNFTSSINLTNPASIASLRLTTFNVGGGVDIRNLKSNTSPDKFRSVNTSITYLQLGFPLKITPAFKWGMSFGLRPVTRINYKIENNERLPNIDSLSSLFQGDGGLTQANIASGIKIRNFSLGFNTGYSFGNKDYIRQKIFINDSIVYQKSNSEIKTRFGGFFLNLGAQYDIVLAELSSANDNRRVLRLGAYTNLQQNLHAKRDDLNETFRFDGNGGTTGIDTVTYKQGLGGSIKYPMSYSAGFTYSDNHWIVGADVDFAKWDQYASFGQKDAAVQNTTTVRVGAEYFPANIRKTPASKYWSFVRYRGGFYYGDSYINIGTNRPEYGATFGAGLPLTTLKRAQPEEAFSVLNLGIDIGARGNKSSESIRENVTRFNVGVSMNTRWFQKRKYN